MTQPSRVLVTGATGFIGSAVVRARSAEQCTRAVSRSVSPGHFERGECTRADLATSDGITTAIEGVSAVIHCASYVGRDAPAAWRTNFEVTRELVSAADTHGVDSFIYVSTASVYAPGVKSGVGEEHPLAPSSEISHSRRAAEEVVLEAGGIVLRPHLLYGIGDRWVIPLLAKVAAGLGLPNDGAARVSLLDVDVLAEQIWELHRDASAHSGRAFNSANGDPVQLREVISMVGAAMPRAETVQLPELTPHQTEMLTSDNWFTSALPTATRPQFELTEPTQEWYSHALRS